MAKTLQIEILEDIGGWGFDTNSMVDQLRGFSGDEIKVPVNSHGGGILEGFGIYNLLRARAEKVTTSVVGYAMSMGTIISSVGDHSTMPKHSRYVLHNPQGGAIGEAKDLQQQADVLSSLKKDLVAMYLAKTGDKCSEAQIIAFMDEEKWLTADEALAFGFIDEITDGAEFKASIPKDILNKYKNVPADLLEPNNKAMADNKETENAGLLDQIKALFVKEEPKAAVETPTDIEALKAENQSLKASITALEQGQKNMETQVVAGFKTVIESMNKVGDGVAKVTATVKEKVVKSEAKNTDISVQINALTEKYNAEMTALKQEINNEKAADLVPVAAVQGTGMLNDKEVEDPNAQVDKVHGNAFMEDFLSGKYDN